MTETIYIDSIIFYLHPIRFNKPSQIFSLKSFLVTIIITHITRLKPLLNPTIMRVKIKTFIKPYNKDPEKPYFRNKKEY